MKTMTILRRAVITLALSLLATSAVDAYCPNVGSSRFCFEDGVGSECSQNYCGSTAYDYVTWDSSWGCYCHQKDCVWRNRDENQMCAVCITDFMQYCAIEA